MNTIECGSIFTNFLGSDTTETTCIEIIFERFGNEVGVQYIKIIAKIWMHNAENNFKVFVGSEERIHLRKKEVSQFIENIAKDLDTLTHVREATDYCESVTDILSPIRDLLTLHLNMLTKHKEYK